MTRLATLTITALVTLTLALALNTIAAGVTDCRTGLVEVCQP